MNNKILSTCLQGNYGDSLGEFNHTSYGVVGAERVKNKNEKKTKKHLKHRCRPRTLSEMLFRPS